MNVVVIGAHPDDESNGIGGTKNITDYSLVYDNSTRVVKTLTEGKWHEYLL